MGGRAGGWAGGWEGGRERDYDLGSLDADAAVGQVGEEPGGHRHGRVLEPAKHRASALRDPKEINKCLDFPDLVSDNELYNSVKSLD